MAGRFLDNLEHHTDACDQPGPFIYADHKNRNEKSTLSDQ
jgi:hypothetical protein